MTLKSLKSQIIAEEPRTLGDHLKRVRQERKVSQKAAAYILGVDPATVLNWEKGKTEPPVKAMPAILRFLGYDPYPEPVTLRERILAKRRAMGWTIGEAAAELGVDPTTWRDWEHGKVILLRKHRAMVATLLGLDSDEFDADMRARWNRQHGQEHATSAPNPSS